MAALTLAATQAQPPCAMRGSDFDELAFFAAIEASGARSLPIAERGV